MISLFQYNKLAALRLLSTWRLFGCDPYSELISQYETQLAGIIKLPALRPLSTWRLFGRDPYSELISQYETQLAGNLVFFVFALWVKTYSSR